MGTSESVTTYYTNLADKFEESYKSVDWGSEEGQKIRFEVIVAIADLRGKTVLDLGCGLGDMYSYLYPCDVEYTGYDITRRMVEIATTRFPKARFECRGLEKDNRKFDYILASGIFSKMGGNPYDEMLNTLGLMFESCNFGVSFNCLNGREFQDKNEFTPDPSKVFDICYKLTKKIILRTDYHNNDLTFYLYR
jgi:SAM-dependent methyltransferase